MNTTTVSQFLATAAQPDSGLMLAIGSVVAIIVFLWLFLWLIPVKLWIAAKTTRTPVGLIDMIAMRFRRVSPPSIVNPMIAAIQARVMVTRAQLESHYLAGGNVWKVVQAMISAMKALVKMPHPRVAIQNSKSIS